MVTAKDELSLSWNLSQFLHGEWPSDIQQNFTSDWPPCLIVRDPVAMNTDGLGRPYVITSILNFDFTAKVMYLVGGGGHLCMKVGIIQVK